MPEMGDIRVFDGTSWVALVSPSTPVFIDPETIGLPPKIGWDPSSTDPDNGDEGTLADTTELLEVLLCPECDFELGCHDPCGARHVYLADHPLEHRLIRPLVEQYLRTINTNKVCAACSMRINPDDGLLHDVMIARDDCPHVLIREGQVTMARSLYESITGELLRMRDKSGRSML